MRFLTGSTISRVGAMLVGLARRACPPSMRIWKTVRDMTDRPIALITGGAQGIGYACAEALAEDGYFPVLADLKDAVTDAALALGGQGYICDMGDVAAVDAMIDRVEAGHGPVSALVNTAGIAMPGDFLSYDLAHFERVLDVNLRGVFVATQRVAKTMVAQQIDCAIVNMASIIAQVVSPPSRPTARRKAA